MKKPRRSPTTHRLRADFPPPSQAALNEIHASSATRPDITQTTSGGMYARGILGGAAVGGLLAAGGTYAATRKGKSTAIGAGVGALVGGLVGAYAVSRIEALGDAIKPATKTYGS